jgi:5-methylcytosine-specific restriction endonuclease McrA
LPYRGKQWQAIRKAQLERYPLCAHCGLPANEVDHIEGDTSKNIIGIDLQSLCKPCHSRKTGLDRMKNRENVSARTPPPKSRACDRA